MAASAPEPLSSLTKHRAVLAPKREFRASAQAAMASKRCFARLSRRRRGGGWTYSNNALEGGRRAVRRAAHPGVAAPTAGQSKRDGNFAGVFYAAGVIVTESTSDSPWKLFERMSMDFLRVRLYPVIG